MDSILKGEQGIPALLAAIVVILCCHLLVQVGKTLWSGTKEKEREAAELMSELTSALHENTMAVSGLDSRLKEVEKDLSEVTKLKKDLYRFYSAIKYLAGDDWGHIRDEILKDEFPA